MAANYHNELVKTQFNSVSRGTMYNSRPTYVQQSV